MGQSISTRSGRKSSLATSCKRQNKRQGQSIVGSAEQGQERPRGVWRPSHKTHETRDGSKERSLLVALGCSRVREGRGEAWPHGAELAVQPSHICASSGPH